MSKDVSQTPGFLKNNIVKIVDQEGNFFGSAFFIYINGKTYGVTCHHCIHILDKILIEKDSKKYLLKWNEKFSDMTKDIAILEMDNDCPIQPLNYNLQALPKLLINMYGYSAKSLNEFPDGKFGGKSELDEDSICFSWKEEILKGKNTFQNKWNKKPKINVNVFEIKGDYEKGFSGAPVYYIGNNNIVGMFIAKDEISGYVLPIQTILEKFHSNGLGYTTGDQDNSSYLEKGNEHYFKREYDRALSLYCKIIKDTNYLSALSNKGRVYVQLNRIKEAINLFKLVLSIDPKFKFALNGMGFALYKTNKFKESIKWFDKALEINPNFIDALNNKGSALLILGQDRESIKWFDKALEINPNFIDALNNKGNFYGKIGKDEEAIKWYDKALEINPNDEHILKNKERSLKKHDI